ncbi:MAG: hypothetical protein V7L31_01840 [Nostoc sp.]
MKSINISLPDTMRTYIEEKVAAGGYSPHSAPRTVTPQRNESI